MKDFAHFAVLDTADIVRDVPNRAIVISNTNAETICTRSSAVFAPLVCSLPLRAISRLVVLLIFSADIWTRSGCRARTGYIGQAEVVLNDVVRAGEIGSEGNIRALLVGGGKALANLGRWISHDFVVADELLAGGGKTMPPPRHPRQPLFPKQGLAPSPP